MPKKKNKLIHSFNSSCEEIGDKHTLPEINENEEDSLCLDDIELIETINRHEAKTWKQNDSFENKKLPENRKKVT